jgi:hypothetical protein
VSTEQPATENRRSLPRRAVDKLKIVAIRQPAARVLHLLDRTQLRLLVATQGSYQPVLRDGQLVGLLTMDNLGEFLSIQAALNQGQRGVRGTLFDHPRRTPPQLASRRDG